MDPKESVHIYEVLKQAKIIYSDRNQRAVGCRRVEEDEGTFGGDEKVA